MLHWSSRTLNVVKGIPYTKLEKQFIEMNPLDPTYPQRVISYSLSKPTTRKSKVTWSKAFQYPASRPPFSIFFILRSMASLAMRMTSRSTFPLKMHVERLRPLHPPLFWAYNIFSSLLKHDNLSEIQSHNFISIFFHLFTKSHLKKSEDVEDALLHPNLKKKKGLSHTHMNLHYVKCLSFLPLEGLRKRKSTISPLWKTQSTSLIMT